MGLFAERCRKRVMPAFNGEIQDVSDDSWEMRFNPVHRLRGSMTASTLSCARKRRIQDLAHGISVLLTRKIQSCNN